MKATAIFSEVFCNFLDQFLLYGSIALYNNYATLPCFNTDVKVFEELYASARYNGCMSSLDTTHIEMLSCSSWASHNHRGHKLSHP